MANQTKPEDRKASVDRAFKEGPRDQVPVGGFPAKGPTPDPAAPKKPVK
jgi:hypothetical protein